MKFIGENLSIALWAVVAFLCVGCSNDETVVARYNNDGDRYSPLALSGTLDYLGSMQAKSVMVVRLDQRLKVVDTLYAKTSDDYYGNPLFSLTEWDYPSPYVKFVTTFGMEDGSGTGDMIFSQLVDISTDKPGYISLNLVDALVSDRIEHFVNKESYGFSEAKEKAYKELSKMFGIEKISTDEVFVYCKHQVSDSVFYATYKDLRKILKNGDTLSTSKRVDIADAYLDTFKGFAERDFFKNVSRDSAYFNYSFFCDFFSWGYGIEDLISHSQTGDTVVIHQKSSKYKGRYFVYDSYVSLMMGYTFKWRLNSDMEDTLGLCLCGADTLVSYNGGYYRCKKDSSAWYETESYQEIFRFMFGECMMYDAEKRRIVYNDSVYMCKCQYIDCLWEFEKEYKDVDTSDADYPKYLDAKAKSLYGECKTNDIFSGQKKEMDGVLVQCQFDTWKQVDSVRFYLGSCTGYDVNNNVVEKLPNGNSYICSSTKNGSEWMRKLGDEYDGEECTEEILGMEIEFDGDIFVCSKSADFELLDDGAWLQRDFIYYWMEQ